MVRISWVNVWTRSRSWSGFIVYLCSLTFWGLSGLFLPTSNQVFLEIVKDIVRHRRPPRYDKRRKPGSETEICKNQENEATCVAATGLDYERAKRVTRLVCAGLGTAQLRLVIVGFSARIARVDQHW
jgi:hypothetical protein